MMFGLLIISCVLGCHGGIGGGQDAIVFDMPFMSGYTAQCVQGVGGEYSHSYDSTFYDIDLDTPNNVDDPIFAPYSGVAYTHTDSPGYGFGNHINIDLGDGTYVILGHLDDVLVDDGEEVSAGQLIGIEGTTGYSTGDHVHMGRHTGNAQDNGTMGDSVEGMVLSAYDSSTATTVEDLTSDMICDLSSGHYYESLLLTPKWHPNGSLVKRFDDSAVYIIENGELRHFTDESVFWSYNLSFDNVSIIDESEFDCYTIGADISDGSKVQAVQKNGQTWLLIGESGGSDSYSVQLNGNASVSVLQSWGIMVNDVGDLPEDSGELSGYSVRSGYAQFRDGSLVTEESDSAVYVMSDGIAMPIESWDTYLLLDFFNRQVITVSDNAIASVQDRVGNCATDLFCLTSQDLFACGGPDDSGDWGGSDDQSSNDDSSSSDDNTSGGSDDNSDDDTSGGSDDNSDDNSGSSVDDFNEGLSWIFVDGDSLGLKIDELFSSSVDGDDVAVTGYGFPSWEYDSHYCVDYNHSTDVGWYRFDNGKYRISVRTSSYWAQIDSQCYPSATRSVLCHLNQNGMYALCFEVRDSGIQTLSEQECREME